MGVERGCSGDVLDRGCISRISPLHTGERKGVGLVEGHPEAPLKRSSGESSISSVDMTEIR